MPEDLSHMTKKMESIVYASSLSAELRNSKHEDDNA